MKLVRMMVVCAALASALGASAQHTNVAALVVGGVEYKNCEIERVNPAEAKLTHSAGLARVGIASLPTELQRFMAYDAQAAAAYRSARLQQSAAVAAQAEKLKSKRTLRCTVDKITDAGILATDRPVGFRPSGDPVHLPARPVFVVGHPAKAKFGIGDLFSAVAYQEGTIQIGGQPFPKYVFVEAVDYVMW